MADSPVDAAGKLVPLIRSCADQIDAARELPRSLFEALADAGMFHLAFPRSLGGAELDLPTYVEVIEEIGKADASTGWIVNQNSIFATYAARMPRDVARAIWVETPRAVVANTPAPTAKAIVVPGGYRVTGRQGFSTGCRHASWVAAHAQIIENGQVRLEGEAPEARYMFVPVAEAELLDTWHTRGMRGTGTHHFAVNDVFVPTDRTVLSQTAPLIEDAPLYRIPRTLLFASGDAAVAFGMARTCLETFGELAGAKTPRAMQALLRDQSMVQMTVGQAEAALRSGRAFLFEAVREIWTASANGAITLDHRANMRLATTHGIRLAAQIIDSLYNLAGATAATRSRTPSVADDAPEHDHAAVRRSKIFEGMDRDLPLTGLSVEVCREALPLGVGTVVGLPEARLAHLVGREPPGRVHLRELEVGRVGVVVGNGPPDDDRPARRFGFRGVFDLARELVHVRGHEVGHADPHEIAHAPGRHVDHARLGQLPVDLGHDSECLRELVAAAQRVQKRGVDRIHAVVLHLEPVARQHELRGRRQPVARHVEAIVDRERRTSVRRAQVGEHQPRELERRIGALPDALLEPTARRLPGRLQASAVDVVDPAVVAAADAALDPDPQLERRPP